MPLFLDDEEDVSYDVIFLFTIISIKHTIEYITEQMYAQKMLRPICIKLIF